MLIMRDEDYNPDRVYRTGLDDRDKLIRKDERKNLLLEIFKKRMSIYLKSSTHEKAWDDETLYLMSMYVKEFGGCEKMIPSKKEGVCSVCGHKQPLPTFQGGDPSTCNKCGHIIKPKMYPMKYEI